MERVETSSIETKTGEWTVGQCVRARRRHWLIEGIRQVSNSNDVLEVRCVDDDAQGYKQFLIPAIETGLKSVDEELWSALGIRAPTDPQGYTAYLQSLQWNLATAADNKLFQAPFRAGIEISEYQLTPLAKALELPRVNMLIADDVGLGKTIEAGLVLREMLLRKRVDFFVVAAPASMTLQWQEELGSKFGLRADIVDKEFFARMRAERGFGYNPWQAGSAFIISHDLFKEESYTIGLQALLGTMRARSMLILDEAHHAAPAHSQAYAVDSKMTFAVRGQSKRFEHRLFLSATPHNGHSNSFSALLEMLDPQRFTRGIPTTPDEHDAIMVRRLKSDLRELTDTPFPKRIVENIELDDHQETAPEIALYNDLLDFSELADFEGGHTFILLQQRLLSSVAAFHTTLKGEVKKMEAGKAKSFAEAMLQSAKKIAFHPDAKSKSLSAWIIANMGQKNQWNERRLIVFSEYRTTIDWLKKQLLQDLQLESETKVIAEFTGDTDKADREQLKSRFNQDPNEEPLRILLCTDAAREGINLQHRCHDLFHFDLPWNPSRLEQRNGRIDRRLQPQPQVFCRYFTYKNRAADRILSALVRKVERINRELGEVGPVIQAEVEARFKTGIRRENAGSLEADLESEAYLEIRRRQEELQIGKVKELRLKKLRAELEQVRHTLELSRLKKNVAPDALQKVFLNALEKMQIEPPQQTKEGDTQQDVFELNPDSAGFMNADWTPVFDELRIRPRLKRESEVDYRSNARLKRVSFGPVKDGDRLDTAVEHLHLEHRLVRRLLAQFEAQGFRSRLGRTAVLQTDTPQPRMILLLRLTLYAKGASRLHSDVFAIAARVSERGVSELKADGKTAADSLKSLHAAMQTAVQPDETVCQIYRIRAAGDATSLRATAELRADEIEQQVRAELMTAGERQAASLSKLLMQQKARILEQQKEEIQIEFEFNEEERKQLIQDKENWAKRLVELDVEIETEPDKVRASYVVKARRLEPVGIVYLLPKNQGNGEQGTGDTQDV